MTTIQKVILEFVCPSMGVIFANLMFSAPIGALNEAVNSRQTLGELNPTPWGEI